MKIIGRIGALLCGLIGTILALIINVAYSAVHDALRLGGAKTIEQSHGFIGLALVVVGFAGALLALPSPTVAALLMLVAAIGLFFVVKVYALLASFFFIVAALLAFLDRKQRAAA